MKTFLCTISALLLVTSVSHIAMAAESQPEKTVKGEQPQASPGWVVVEEDFWLPMSHEPLTAAQKARQHYILNEEKAAANELKKVVAWAQLAEAHATKEGSIELQILTGDLRALIDDLEKGKAPKARMMDDAMARIDHAFANHHYLKAKDALGKKDTLHAAEHLIAASAYLKNAAGSAGRDISPDTVEYFDEADAIGKDTANHVVIKHPQLSDHLMELESELEKLASSITRQAE